MSGGAYLLLREDEPLLPQSQEQVEERASFYCKLAVFYCVVVIIVLVVVFIVS
jgi:hypothetical protein